MKTVVVILEHDGTGDGAVPIATIVLPSGHEMWPVEKWLRDHDWNQGLSHEGHPTWYKTKSTLYGYSTRSAAISEPMRLEETE
jgi:hypothetical protein